MNKMFLLPILSLVAIVSAANGYAIFAYDATNTTTLQTGANSKSTWDTDIFADAYNGATYQNPTNPFYTSAKLAVDEGVLKLKGVALPATGYPGAMLGIKNGTGTKKISDCTGGISYWYKGDAHTFSLEFDFSVCATGDSDGSNKWKKTTAAATTWTKETVTTDSLALATWNGAECTATNASAIRLDKVSQMAWVFDTPNSSNLNLMVGDIVCLGGSTAYEDKQPAAAVAITTGCFADNLGPCAPASSSSTPSSSSITTSSSSGGSSSSNGGSSSSEDPEPIISHSNTPVVGLNVVSFARSLQIASSKNATISLFDINGKQVLSQKVLSGVTTISLRNQKVGVYYAVAKSDSQKQIVKIVLK